MNGILRAAIANRETVEFDYDGGRRVAEPHAYGRSRTGKDVVRAFQVSGFSQSGSSVGWKLFEVAKMTSLRAAGDRFAENRPGYNPDDSAMVAVYCRV